MNHPKALKIFDRRLTRLLMLRGAVQWMTLWFFVWGVVVLAGRISGVLRNEWLALGLFGVFPLMALAAWRAHQQRPEFVKIRASYDRLKLCGGVMMSEETADMSAWQAQLGPASAPELRWKSGRAMLLLTVSAAFVVAALLLPERLTKFSSHRPLEISVIVDQLQAEVQTLQQEKIVEDKKADDLQKQLSQIKQDSSGLDPNKTWEALDHIKESNSDVAKQAAEEALTKTKELTQAETLARAMEQAADSGMSADTATQAAQDLAGMLNAAKLEEGLLNGKIPPELLSGLNGLNKEQMQKLLSALKFNKNALAHTVSNLAQLKLIDASKLGECKNAGQCTNPNALSSYLSTCTNGCSGLVAMCQSLCNGGISRDLPSDTPMTWTDGASEDNAKFKEQTLPPSTHLSDAQLVGVSRAAPDMSGDDLVAGHGALARATGSGGSAHSQIVLPEHRQAVQKFFKRDGK
jgi:hypothetical protein